MNRGIWRGRRGLVVCLVALAVSAAVLMVAGQPGWIMLAAAGGVLATRGWVRRAVAVLTILVAVAFLVSALSTSQPLGAIGALLAAAAGVWAVVLSRSWPSLGARYQAGPAPTMSDWDALDAGIDPTDRPSG